MLSLTTNTSASDSLVHMYHVQWQENGSSSTGIAQRARHPDEVKKGNGKWIIDIDYYLAQQVPISTFMTLKNLCCWLYINCMFPSLSLLFLVDNTDSSSGFASLRSNSGY